jgi:hypothetical protein
MRDEVDEAGQAGWTLVQLSEMVRRVEELLLDGITLAGPHLHAGMPPDAVLELTATDVRRVVAALAEGMEIAERLELLAAHLPDGPVDAEYEAVRDAAAADLARGIVDPRRALLAARLLDVEHGWPALATALSSGDATDTWQSLTVEELLTRFRGADRDVARALVADAGLAPDARFASAPPERLAALADRLRRHAGRPAA